MVRNTFFAPIFLPSSPQPGGLGLYQVTGLLTPPPTPPPPPPAPSPYPNVDAGFFDEDHSTSPNSPQLGGLEFSEAVSATLPTSPQLGGLGIYAPEPHLGDTGSVDMSISGSSQTEAGETTTGSEVDDATQLEAQASFTPATAPEPTDEESNDEEHDENQGGLVGHSPFLDSPNLRSSPLFAFAPRMETMLPLPCLSPEMRGTKRQRSGSLGSREEHSHDEPSKRHRGEDYVALRNGLAYLPLILLDEEEGVEEESGTDDDLLDGPKDLYLFGHELNVQ